MSKTVYKDYSASEKAKIYELHLARLDNEGPQGDRKKYVHKIKSLQHQFDETRMGNYDPSDDEVHIYDSTHTHIEGDRMENKDNKNLVRQGGP